MSPYDTRHYLRGEFDGMSLGQILKRRGGPKYLRALKSEFDITPPLDERRKLIHEALKDIAEDLEEKDASY